MKTNRKLLSFLAMLLLLSLAFDGCDSGGGSASATATVTYNTNGHGTAPAAETVKVGSKLTAPTEPTADGYIFSGWYEDVGCTRLWSFSSDIVTGDLTLYAKWIDMFAFSVGANSKVRFAKGNLYWSGSEFKLETSQTAYPSTWDANHVGHFYYSKDATIAYASDYSDSGASTSNVLFTNATETTANSSFTVDGEAGKWRTLSKGEWEYLLEDRANAAQNIGYATVGGVNGLILLPDLFTDPEKNAGSMPFVPAYTTGWNTNTYDAAGWAAMEAAGAVFLPAAGGRIYSSGTSYNGLSISDSGVSGLYWSSTAKDDIDSDAWAVNFGSAVVNSSDYPRSTGRPIRLVYGAN